MPLEMDLTDTKPVDVKTRNEEKDNGTKLFEASIRGSIRILWKLLKAGANVDVRVGDLSLTPLMGASGSGNIKAISCLLDRKAKVDFQDSQGQTALMHASKNHHSEVVDLLLKVGANPYIRDESGNTAQDFVLQHSTTFMKLGGARRFVNATQRDLSPLEDLWDDIWKAVGIKSILLLGSPLQFEEYIGLYYGSEESVDGLMSGLKVEHLDEDNAIECADLHQSLAMSWNPKRKLQALSRKPNSALVLRSAEGKVVAYTSGMCEEDRGQVVAIDERCFKALVVHVSSNILAKKRRDIELAEERAIQEAKKRELEAKSREEASRILSAAFEVDASVTRKVLELSNGDMTQASSMLQNSELVQELFLMVAKEDRESRQSTAGATIAAVLPEYKEILLNVPHVYPGLQQWLRENLGFRLRQKFSLARGFEWTKKGANGVFVDSEEVDIMRKRKRP